MMDAEPEAEVDADAMFRTALVMELGLGALALFLGWLTAVNVHQWLPALSLATVTPILTSVLLGTLAALPLLLVVEVIERIDWEPFRQLKRLEDVPMISAMLSLRPMELIAVSIAAGVGEELLLRGWLMAWLMGPWETATAPMIALALIASSLAFGLMHPVTPTYVVLATLVGVYFGALVLWRGDLLIAIVAHSVYDAIHLLLARRARLQAASSDDA